MTKTTTASANFRLPFAARVVAISALVTEGDIAVSGAVAVTMGDAPGFQFAMDIIYNPLALNTTLALVAGGAAYFSTITAVANTVHLGLPDAVLPANCLIQCAVAGGSAWNGNVYINIEPF